MNNLLKDATIQNNDKLAMETESQLIDLDKKVSAFTPPIIGVT